MKELAINRWVNGTLIFLIVFDIVVAVLGFFFPDFWFHLLHGTPYVDPQGLLQRCAANWTGFTVFQIIALGLWKRHPHWLVIAAGIRFSDLFTDLTYWLFASELTWFGGFILLLIGPINLVLGLFYMGVYKRMTG